MSDCYKICGRGQYHKDDFDTGSTGSFKNARQAREAMAENLEKINELQQKLYAEKREGVIFLFQAMDAAGIPYRELDVFELARMGAERLLGVPGATERYKEEEE